MFHETSVSILRALPIFQNSFVSTMQTIVSKKQAYKVKREEGWYSVDEMKNELGWSQ